MKTDSEKPKDRKEYATIHFRDGLDAFLSYSERQLAKNPNYDPNPILKAFNLALTKIEDASEGQHTMGVSGYDGSYVVLVIIKKEGGSIRVSDIRHAQTGKSMPVELIFKLFRLQTKIDSFPEGIPTKDLVAALDDIFTEFHFHYLGDKWKEARDLFLKNINERKISITQNENTQQIIEDLCSIKADTPWEEYSPSARSLIGGSARDLFDKRPNSITITNPEDSMSEPGKIFDLITFQYLGEGAKFFGFADCIFCGQGEAPLSIASVWDHHILLPNKYSNFVNQFMIVPKTHTRAICDLSVSQIREVEELIEIMEEYYSACGIKEWSFIESGFVLQSVYHAHIHVLPFKINPESEWKIKLIDKQKIKSFEEGVEFYKKHGSYLIIKNNEDMYIGKPEIKKDQKQSLSELINGFMWKDLSNEDYLKKEENFKTTCDLWNNWGARKQ